MSLIYIFCLHVVCLSVVVFLSIITVVGSLSGSLSFLALSIGYIIYQPSMLSQSLLAAFDVAELVTSTLQTTDGRSGVYRAITGSWCKSESKKS